MAIVQNIDLNLIPDSEAVVVKVNQYDDGTGRINAHLYLNDTAYTPASGATVRIEGTKPDKHGFSYTASISGNTVTANLTTQMTAVAGRTRAQIIVEEPSGKTGTFAFWLDVQAAALADDTDISDTELPAIMDLARRNAEIAVAAAEAADDSAEDAEAWAVGTRDGSAVSSTDPTYHNNSKYYAEQAGEHIDNAEAWAVGTRQGQPVSSSDETYHNNSKYYAEQAGASAAAAAAWSEHPPYIGANGNWYIYDTTTHAFVDSGIDASITVDIADITMLSSSDSPYVTNTGSNTDPIFHLFIPRGYNGVGISSITKTDSQTVSGRVVDTYTITYTDNTTTTYQVVNGKDGADGQGSGDMLKSTYDPNNTQYPLNVMTGATAQAIGGIGFVPLPGIGDHKKFLKGDATWAGAVPTFATMPTASSANEGDIVQFVGATTGSYTNGYFYKCVEDSSTNPSTYSWEQTNVQPSSNTQEIFIAEYGVTTYSEINTAFNAGKTIIATRTYNGTTWTFLLEAKDSLDRFWFSGFGNVIDTHYAMVLESPNSWDIYSAHFAPRNNPAFTGTPTAPTAAAGTNNTQIATTAFVADAMTNTAEGVNSNLATIETTTTASQAYAVGDYLVYGGQLYKVTAAIASGGTIIPTGSGANVAATTVILAINDMVGLALTASY